jgi:outer membrane protein TolC
MAVAYVGLDKARDRVELKQMAETDLLKLEDEYQQMRRRLTASTNAQRGARAALAIAMNRPADLPAELVRPKLTALGRKQGELDALMAEALSRNPLLQALRAEVRREQGRVAEAEASSKPVLSGRLGAAAYHRDLGGYNPLAAELTLEVPLYSGGRVEAKAAKARSGVMMKSAELQSSELDIQRRITDLWLELQELKVAKEGLTTRAHFREMNLDRSRALYELEVNTDLGDSMVAISQQKLEEAELGFRAELAWAEMEALTGRLADKE